MRSRPPSFVAAAAVALASLAACAVENPNPVTPAGSGSAASYPVTVGSLTLEKRPERIISLSPTATEMLFAIGAGKQVAAVDDNSNFPADAPKKALSGFAPNPEAIAGYQPDLVIMAAKESDKAVATLKTLRIPVFLAPAATTLIEAYNQIGDLGTLTGHRTEAADLTRRMDAEITKLVKDLPPRSKKLTYYYELDQSLFTVTSKTFIGALFTMVGLENVADPADTTGGGYPQLNQETLIDSNPDMIFLADVKCCQQSAATVKTRAGWAGIAAVKNNQVVELDDDIASRWGPRVVDLVRAITTAVAKAPA